MALKAGYYGIKKKMVNKLTKLTGIYSIGSGLNLSSAGSLSVKNATTSQKGIVQLDEVPTENSTNVPMSGGVYSGIQDVYEVNGVVGAKNWLETSLARIKAINTSGTWNDNVYTFRDTTFTVNSDLSITVNNSATPSTPPYFYSQIYSANTHAPFDGKNLILNGCPEGGGDTTYRLRFDKYDGTNNGFDSGAGVNLTPETVNVDKLVYIQVYSQVTNKVFSPMLRLATDTDSTYVPYAETNYQLTTSKANASALGTVENGTTASKAYAVGEHFYKDGYFCTVTSAIASGGTLTKGTNYTEGDVSDALDDKMGILVDSSTSITNLDNIPVGCGYIKLDGSVSMTGSPFAGEYLCIGDPNGNRSLFMYRYATTTLYVCHRTSGTWTSWTSLTFS